MTLRRGFKSEAERIAAEIRARLDVNTDAPVSPEALAELLGIELRAGDELIERARFEELDQLQRGAFSACTFRPSPNRIVVVYNPLNTSSRRASDLAHELAHVLLEHELTRLETLGDITFFACDAIQEEEAGWLAGCLLLPRPLLLALVRKGLGPKEVAARLKVSEEMARYRINVTGVLQQGRVRKLAPRR